MSATVGCKNARFIVKNVLLCLKGVRMSQLRQEESETIISMLQRHCADNRSVSVPASPDLLVGNDESSSLENGSSSELNGQLLQPSQTMIEPYEKDSKCSGEAVPHCPVCGKSLQWVSGNEALLNRHVDECLNKVAVSELLASERQISSVSR